MFGKILQFDILQVQFQEGKVSPATAELYKVLKDHKNPFMQDLVSSSFKHCYQDEARKVVGRDGLCTHRKARTALTTTKKTNRRCASRKNPKHLPTCLPTTLHSTFRVHRRPSRWPDPEKKTSPCRKPVVHWTAEENNQFFPLTATPSKLVFCSSDYFQSVLFDVIC